MTLLIPILESLIPTLVNQAEKLFPAPASGNDKYAWVQGMLNEFITGVSNALHAPSWIVPIEGELEIWLKTLIEKELAKIDP